jgi:Family of unknown function (DUF6535)
VQSTLQPDNSATTVALLKILIHKIDNSTFPGINSTLPEWTGPDSNMVAVQTLLCSSLAATLFAAFLGMLRKQWINKYGEGKRGNSFERCRERQQKLDGIEKWKFYVIMEGMPMMLQSGLLLLGIALSRYMWGFSRTVASAIIGVTSFGILFYTFILLSATIFDYCPFQTPISQIFRYMIEYSHEKSNYSRFWPGSSAHRYFKFMVDFVDAVKEMLEHPPHPFVSVDLMGPNVDPLFDNREVDSVRNRVDARCIMWLRETCIDSESPIALATMRFIPEVEWNADIDVAPPPLELITQLHEYCSLMRFYPATIPNTREKAYATAKAFLHLYVQRRCVNEQEISQIRRGICLGTREGQWDNDLESTLWMIDHIAEGHEKIIWAVFNDDTKVSIPHLSWISHVLLYHIWVSSCLHEMARIDSEGLDRILAKIWSCRESLSLSTIAECIMIRCLTLGMQINVQDLPAIDKKSVMILIFISFLVS